MDLTNLSSAVSLAETILLRWLNDRSADPVPNVADLDSAAQALWRLTAIRKTLAALHSSFPVPECEKTFGEMFPSPPGFVIDDSDGEEYDDDGNLKDDNESDDESDDNPDDPFPPPSPNPSSPNPPPTPRSNPRASASSGGSHSQISDPPPSPSIRGFNFHPSPSAFRLVSVPACALSFPPASPPILLLLILLLKTQILKSQIQLPPPTHNPIRAHRRPWAVRVLQSSVTLNPLSVILFHSSALILYPFLYPFLRIQYGQRTPDLHRLLLQSKYELGRSCP